MVYCIAVGSGILSGSADFTNDSYIFMFEQLTYNAQYHTVDAVSNIVSGSFMQGEVPGAGTTMRRHFMTSETVSESARFSWHAGFIKSREAREHRR